MEGIDLLQNLQNEHERLCKEVCRQQDELAEKLNTLFSNIYDYDGLKLMPCKCTISRYWHYSNDSDDKKSAFTVNTGVSFYDKDGRTYNDGSPREEFGASISLKIYEYGIRMSYGSCGEYGRDDKGQVSRAMMAAKLWENEDVIVAMAKATINMVDYDEMVTARRKIDQINSDIKEAERLRERAKTLSQIRKAKYICKRKINEVLKKDENGDYVQDENYNFIVEKKVYTYYNRQEITKITESNVLTKDSYWGDKHRLNLDSVINDVQRGSLFLQTESIEEEEVPKE